MGRGDDMAAPSAAMLVGVGCHPACMQAKGSSPGQATETHDTQAEAEPGHDQYSTPMMRQLGIQYVVRSWW